MLETQKANLEQQQTPAPPRELSDAEYEARVKFLADQKTKLLQSEAAAEQIPQSISE